MTETSSHCQPRQNLGAPQGRASTRFYTTCLAGGPAPGQQPPTAVAGQQTAKGACFAVAEACKVQVVRTLTQASVLSLNICRWMERMRLHQQCRFLDRPQLHHVHQGCQHGNEYCRAIHSKYLHVPPYTSGACVVYDECMTSDSCGRDNQISTRSRIQAKGSKGL